MPEAQGPASTTVPQGGDGIALGETGGAHVFALPTSHSVRLAQAAAVATGVLALLVLGLRFVDVRDAGGDLPPLAPAAPLERAEVDLPNLTKPVRSEIPRFRVDAPQDASPAAEAPEPASAAVPVAREPAEAVHGAGAAPHAAEMPFAGVWGPDDSACTPRTNRAGYLPAVITAQGAFAGETSCAFRNAKPLSGGWSVTASCQNAKGRWTTQVRLTVAGRRLTWSSARGNQTYVRCGESGSRARG